MVHPYLAFFEQPVIVLIGIPVLWGFTGLCIAVHEAAHAAAGLAVGLPPQRIMIGLGPARWTWRATVRGVPVSAGPFMIAGAVAFGDAARTGPPLPRIAVLLAGPTANIALAIAMLAGIAGWAPVAALPAILAHLPGAIVHGVIQSIQAPVDPTIPSTDPVTWRGAAALFAALSLSIGALNLAPFPPLDGGNVVLAALDSVGLGTPLVRRTLTGIGLAGVAFLMIPSVMLMAVPWRSTAGPLALALIFGLLYRLARHCAHRRWGTPPLPRLFG